MCHCWFLQSVFQEHSSFCFSIGVVFKVPVSKLDEGCCPIHPGRELLAPAAITGDCINCLVWGVGVWCSWWVCQEGSALTFVCQWQNTSWRQVASLLIFIRMPNAMKKMKTAWKFTAIKTEKNIWLWFVFAMLQLIYFISFHSLLFCISFRWRIGFSWEKHTDRSSKVSYTSDSWIFLPQSPPAAEMNAWVRVCLPERGRPELQIQPGARDAHGAIHGAETENAELSLVLKLRMRRCPRCWNGECRAVRGAERENAGAVAQIQEMFLVLKCRAWHVAVGTVH